MLAATVESTKAEAGKQKVLMVKDTSVQTTPPNSPTQRRQRSQPEVTAGSKVNGPATPEFRTVVNVFDDRLRQASSETDRRPVVMDTDSLQSAAAAAAVNGRRTNTTDKPRRTNGPDKPHHSKGQSSYFQCSDNYTGWRKNGSVDTQRQNGHDALLSAKC